MGKVIFDVVLAGLQYLLARNIDITALSAEVTAAKAEGRPVNVQPFQDQADDAQAAAHARVQANDAAD